MYSYDVPAAFCFSSIFRRAAKIISSLLLWKFACLSVLLELQPALCAASASAGSAPVDTTFDERLYRVIRSGCDGLFGFGCEDDVVLVCAIGGRNDGGGYEREEHSQYHIHHVELLSNAEASDNVGHEVQATHHFQPSPSEHSF